MKSSVHTGKFSVFKSELQTHLHNVGALDCWCPIMNDVFNFIFSLVRMSNKYHRTYWLCRNEDGSVDLLDSYNHGEDYVDGTLFMTVTIDARCFLNVNDYVIDVTFEDF